MGDADERIITRRVFESDLCEYGWETPWRESRPIPGRTSSATGVQGAKARGVALLGARVALLGARVPLSACA
jgi:hypothetical protein